MEPARLRSPTFRWSRTGPDTGPENNPLTGRPMNQVPPALMIVVGAYLQPTTW
jgi:hypothetical protein